MAFKLTTQINVQVNGGQLTAAATKIRQRLEGVVVKVGVEPTSGSLKKLRPAISKKLDSASFPFKVHVTRGSLRIVRKDIQQSVSGVKAVVDVAVNQKALGQVKALNTAIKNTGAQSKVTGGLLEKLGKDAALAIRRFGAFTVATSIIFGFVVAVKQAVGEAIAFERQIVKVSQVTGRSIAQLSGLKAEITSLSVQFGVSSISLAETARILSQTGLSANEVTIALRTLAKTQLAPTFGDINKTTEASIAIMRQFGKGAEGLEKQLGAVNAVAGKFAVESDDIAVAVRRTGGAFKAAGGDLNDLIALFTSVRSTTRESAESIATGFRTIFTRLQRTRTQGFLSKLGIDLQEDGQFVGPLKAIEKLSNALADVPSTDPRFAAVLEELGGFRQISKAIPLIQQFATTRAALSVIQKEANSLDIDAAKAQETLAVRIDQVKQQFVALIREVSDTATFRAFVDITLRLASALIKVADSIKPLIPLITVLAGATLGRAIGPIAKGFLPGLKGEGKNAGGLIPGRGPNVDSVAAILTKGEFVLQRSAVDKIGVDNLRLLNAGKFNRGGSVRREGFQDGNVVEQGASSPLPETFALRGASSKILPKVIVDLGRVVQELSKNVITQAKILEGVSTGRTSVPLTKSETGTTFKLDKQQKFAEDQIARERRIRKEDTSGSVETFDLKRGKEVQKTLFGDSDRTAGLRDQDRGGVFNGSSSVVRASAIRKNAATQKAQQQLELNFPSEPPKNPPGTFTGRGAFGRGPADVSIKPSGVPSTSSQAETGAALSRILLISTALGGVANTFFKLDDQSTDLEKAMKKVTDGTIAAASQFLALSFLLDNVNFDKAAESIGGFADGVKNFKIKGTLTSFKKSLSGGLRGSFGSLKAAAAGSFASSTAGQLSAGTLSGSQLKSSVLKAGAIGIIGNQIGGAVQQTGLENITATGEGRNQVLAGGAISGASTGAAIGSIFGPFGIAAGAAAGALIGLARAGSEARIRLEDFENTQFIKLLSGAEKQFEKSGVGKPGQIKDPTKAFKGVEEDILKRLRQASKDIRLVSVGDKTQGGQFTDKGSLLDVGRALIIGTATGNTRENTVKNVKTGEIIVDLNERIDSLKKRSVGDVAAFKALAKGGKDFNEILSATGFSMIGFAATANLAGEDVIALRSELNSTARIADINNKAQQLLANSVKESISVFQSITKLRSNLLSASLASQIFARKLGALQGNIILPDFRELFQGAASGPIGEDNLKILNRRLDQLGKSGPSSLAVTEAAKGEAALLQALPELFKVIKKTPALGEEPAQAFDTADRAEEILRNAAGVSAKTAVKQSNILLEALQSLSPDALSDISLEKLKSVIVGGSKNLGVAAQLDTAKLQADKSLLQSLDARIAKENEVNSILTQGINIRGQREDTIAKALGQRQVPLSQRLQRSTDRTTNALRGTGLTGNNSVAEISAARNAAQQQVNQGNATVSLVANIKAYDTTLKLLRDNTQNAAEIQKSLNIEQDKRRSKLGIAQIQTFGSASEKRELKRERQALAKIEDVGAGGVSSKTRERALSFLNRLSAEEGKRRKGAIIDRAGEGGPGITKPSIGELVLIQKLDNAFQQRENANTSLAEIANNTAIAIGKTAQQGASAIGREIGRNAGGFIPGVGNSDSINARLTPGEFIIRKESASILGSQFLNEMNNVSKKSTKGVGSGMRFQEGGLVTGFGDGGNVNLQGVATFNIAVSNFVSGVNTLSSSLDAFPREITGNFRHSVEVIFNGAEIMTRLMPEIQDIALNAAKRELRKFVSEKLPDIGPLD